MRSLIHCECLSAGACALDEYLIVLMNSLAILWIARDLLLVRVNDRVHSAVFHQRSRFQGWTSGAWQTYSPRFNQAIIFKVMFPIFCHRVRICVKHRIDKQRTCVLATHVLNITKISNSREYSKNSASGDTRDLDAICFAEWPRSMSDDRNRAFSMICCAKLKSSILETRTFRWDSS